jgi:hypothetical protein
MGLAETADSTFEWSEIRGSGQCSKQLVRR